MTFALVLFWEGEGTLSPADAAALHRVLATTPGLSDALIFTPEVARDIYIDDGAAPPLGLQLHFAGLPDLEAAAGRAGHLQALATLCPSLRDARITQQAMLVRPYPVDDPVVRPVPGVRPCSYVVHYPGPAQDLNLWLTHYIDSHPPLMRRFPGVRSIEILTRIDWCTALPFTRVGHMQRNRILFDSAAALTAALQSPVRHEMRADFHALPPFEGGNAHFPMATETVHPARGPNP